MCHTCDRVVCGDIQIGGDINSTMCRHCENLQEDRDFVHRFMELTAARLNEAAAKDGHNLSSPITPDDVDIQYKVRVVSWERNPLYSAELSSRLLRALDDSSK